MNDRFRSPREGGAPSSADFREGEDDLLLRQVRAALTPMPAVDRRAIAQILTAVADRKRTPWQRFLGRFEGVREWWQFSTPPWLVWAAWLPWRSPSASWPAGT